MKAVNFVPSTISTIRHERKMLVHNKAGIFRFQKELAIYTCRAVVIMATAPRAERLMVDSGKGKSPFCLPALNVNHHAHRNSILRRPAAHQIPHYHSCPIAQAGGRNGAPIKATARRVYSTKAGNKAPGVSSISLSFSVF